jgi:uncharacterized membrane protein YkvI
MKPVWRLALSTVVVLTAMFVATRVGLVALIAQGYGFSAYLFLAIFVVPLLLVGGWMLLRQQKSQSSIPAFD